MGKRSGLTKSARVQRKESRKKAIKEERIKAVVIENADLLNKQQLKKIVKQPTNNLRASGKRKRKMMKRLKHSQKDKSQMEVEVANASKSKTKDSKDMNADMAEEEDDDASDAEMT